MMHKKTIWITLLFQAIVFSNYAQQVMNSYLESDSMYFKVRYDSALVRYPFHVVNNLLIKNGIFVTGNDKCASSKLFFEGPNRGAFFDEYFKDGLTDLAYHSLPNGLHYVMLHSEGRSAASLVRPPLPCVNGGCFDSLSVPYTVNLKLTTNLIQGQPYRLIYYDAAGDTSMDNKSERERGCNRGWDVPDKLMCGLAHATDTFAQSIIDTLLITSPSNKQWTRRMIDFTASDTFGYVSFRNYSKYNDTVQSRHNGLDFVQLYAFETSSVRYISKCPEEILRLQLPEGAISYEWSVKAPYTTPRIIGSPTLNFYYDTNMVLKLYPVPTITTLNGDSLSFLDVKDSGWYWCTTYLTDSTYRVDSFHMSYGISASNNIIGGSVSISLCEGKSTVLSSPRNYATSYQWSTADTSAQITVINEGQYIVMSTYIQCITYDTFKVYYATPLGTMKDTSICESTNIDLVAKSANRYLWNTGDTSQNINVTDSGLYIVKRWIENECMQIDTFTVQTSSTPQSLLQDTSICEGENIILTALPASLYQWNTGDTTQAIQVRDAGKYAVIKTIPPCQGIETFNVTTYPLPQITTVKDTTVCFDEVKHILLDAGQFAKYLWEPTGETTRTIYSNMAQVYLLTVTDSNSCVSSKAFAVMEECPYSLYIPNAFTPNNDDVNDVLVIKGNRIDSFRMIVINRWGQIVFETNRMDDYWSGTNCEDGVYTLFIEYIALGKNNSYKGTVTLLR
jgi:gliding motility-associated-like protein